ncbi:putative motility protein [Sulfurimonas sp.]
MEVSSSTTSANVQVDVMKKAQDVQEKQITQLLESAQQQSKDMATQKTGIGGNLNLTG